MLLPIDAKLPVEDYRRLQSAYDGADGPAIQKARAALRGRALVEAQSISSKYVCPPHTTDFGDPVPAV